MKGKGVNVMKRGMKKLFILSLCICTVMGQTVYAQGEAAGEPGTTEAYEQKHTGKYTNGGKRQQNEYCGIR